MREGLIPSYAHNLAGSPERSETPAEAFTTSSAFRCTFRRRRCIIPADVFNECQHKRTPFPVPCSFAPDIGDIFGIAGVWESWRNDAGEEILSFAIVTAHVSHSLGAIFDRMPIVISEINQERWLACAGTDTLPRDLLQTLSIKELRTWKMMPCDETPAAPHIPALHFKVSHLAIRGENALWE